MTILEIIIFIAFQLVIISFAQYPIWIFKYAFKGKANTTNQVTTRLSSIAISLLLFWVVCANIITIILDFETINWKVYEYLALFYGIILIVLISVSMFCVMSNYVLNEKLKHQKRALRFFTGLVIVIGILFLYFMIIVNAEAGINYIETGSNYFLPIFTSTLIILVIVNAIQKRNIRVIFNKDSILLLLSLLFAVLDLVVIKNTVYQATILFYALYALRMFNQLVTQLEPNGIHKRVKISDERFVQKYNLSQREMEVIELVCNGLTNKEIAEKLFLSPHTIKSHLKRIFSKLMVDSRHKLMEMVSDVELDNRTNKSS